MIDPNLYRIIGDISEPGMCYEYHDLRVFQRLSDRRLFYATDCGCSCPEPFESCDEGDLLPYSHKAIWEWATKAKADPSELLRLCDKAMS